MGGRAGRIGIGWTLALSLSTAAGAQERPAWFRCDGGRFSVANVAQGLRARFDEGGVTLTPLDAAEEDATPWRWRFRLRRVGRPGARVPVGAPTARNCCANLPRDAAACRRFAWRWGSLTEFYRNERRGFEQSFVLAGGPRGAGLIVLDADVAGDLAPERDGTWRGAGGALGYSGLVARDALGRDLPARMQADGAGVRILVEDLAARYPIVIDPVLSDPSERAGVVSFAASAAPAGDVDGDGLADVAAIRDDRPALLAGGVAGPAPPSWIGGVAARAVAGAGDVNGDGFADVIAGGGGRAFAWLGGASGLPAAPSWSVAAPAGGDVGFGTAVAGAGDVDGDGFADVLVGAPRWSGVAAGEGIALLYRGSATGLRMEPAWTADPTGEAGAAFGAAVAGAGDVDGDGFSDVLVGAPLGDGDVVDEGRAFLFRGGASGLAREPAWTIDPADQPQALAGAAVAGAGDVDGDGFSDVLVGAPWWDGDAEDAGRAWLFRGGPDGPARQPAWSIPGAGAAAHAGRFVGGAGDVDGDGFADALVGGRDGAALVLGSAEPHGLARPLGRTAWPAGDVNGDGYADLSAALDDDGVASWFAGAPCAGDPSCALAPARAPACACDVGGGGRAPWWTAFAALAISRRGCGRRRRDVVVRPAGVAGREVSTT